MGQWVYQGPRHSRLVRGHGKDSVKDEESSGQSGVPQDPDQADHKLRPPSANASGVPRVGIHQKSLVQRSG